MNQKLGIMISSRTIFVACVGLDSKIRKARTKSIKKLFPCPNNKHTVLTLP